MVCRPRKIPGRAIRPAVQDRPHVVDVLGEVGVRTVKGLRDHHEYEANGVTKASSPTNGDKSHPLPGLIGGGEISLVPDGARATLAIHLVQGVKEICRGDSGSLCAGECSEQHGVHHQRVGRLHRELRFEVLAHPGPALQLENVFGVETSSKMRAPVRSVPEATEIQATGFDSRSHRWRRQNTHAVTRTRELPADGEGRRNVPAAIPGDDHKAPLIHVVLGHGAAADTRGICRVGHRLPALGCRFAAGLRRRTRRPRRALVPALES